MPRYRTEEIAELRRQLSYSQGGERTEQLARLESFLREIDPNRPYPTSVVFYQITHLRPSISVDTQIQGQVARCDLALLLYELSAALDLASEEAGGNVLTVEEVKEMYDVSESTISRWRSEGLICKKYTFPDGKRKTGILDADLRGFIAEHADRIHKSANLAPLTEAAKAEIVQQARVLVARGGSGLSDVSGRLAELLRLPKETLLYTLKRHDEEHPDRPLFPDALFPLTEECKREIFRMYNGGESIEDISRKYRRARSSIYRIVRELKAEQILTAKTNCIFNPIFEDPQAEQIILGVEAKVRKLDPAHDEPLPGMDEPPSYVREASRASLLSRDEEVDLFRRYNYIKYKLAKVKSDLTPSDLSAERLQEIVDLEAMADAVKNRIIEANLRLVISIAKKYVGPQTCFSELVSDGNVSLMRAVEKFDYSRGIRFSTYASWAIMKNFAKTIPEENFQQDRFTTGNQEMLDILPDSRDKYRHRADFLLMIKQVINELLDELTEREKDILICRYGIQDGQPHTLEQVGEEFSVTRERVRQIETRALRKLRTILGERKFDELE